MLFLLCPAYTARAQNAADQKTDFDRGPAPTMPTGLRRDPHLLAPRIHDLMGASFPNAQHLIG